MYIYIDARLLFSPRERKIANMLQSCESLFLRSDCLFIVFQSAIVYGYDKKKVVVRKSITKFLPRTYYHVVVLNKVLYKYITLKIFYS